MKLYYFCICVAHQNRAGIHQQPWGYQREHVSNRRDDHNVAKSLNPVFNEMGQPSMVQDCFQKIGGPHRPANVQPADVESRYPHGHEPPSVGQSNMVQDGFQKIGGPHRPTNVQPADVQSRYPHGHEPAMPHSLPHPTQSIPFEGKAQPTSLQPSATRHSYPHHQYPEQVSGYGDPAMSSTQHPPMQPPAPPPSKHYNTQSTDPSMQCYSSEQNLFAQSATEKPAAQGQPMQAPAHGYAGNTVNPSVVHNAQRTENDYPLPQPTYPTAQLNVLCSLLANQPPEVQQQILRQFGLLPPTTQGVQAPTAAHQPQQVGMPAQKQLPQHQPPAMQSGSIEQGGQPQQHKQPSPQLPTSTHYQTSRTQLQQQAASTTQVQPDFVQQNIAAYEENVKQKMELMKLQDQASSHHNILLNPQSPDYMNPQEESQYPEPEFQSPVSCVGHKQELIEQQQWEEQQWLQQQDKLRGQEHLNTSTESPITSNDVNNYSVNQHKHTHYTHTLHSQTHIHTHYTHV